MKLTRKAFTLVELIIVIAIIAVLAVSAFMVLTKWLGKSRDSRRLGDIGAIERALSTWLSDYDDNGKGLLVTPANSSQGVDGASTGDSFSNYFTTLKTKDFDVLQKTVKDPADKEYRIAIANNKLFSVAATLENDGSYEAAVRQNYTPGDTFTGYDDTAFSGASLITKAGTVAEADADIVSDGGTTNLPYSLQ